MNRKLRNVEKLPDETAQELLGPIADDVEESDMQESLPVPE
jgi:hypothetical protein